MLHEDPRDICVVELGWQWSDSCSWCKQAFAINPSRLVFPYFGVVTNLLQCCGLCSAPEPLLQIAKLLE